MEYIKLDYFYGNEAEKFDFYSVPKVFFTDARYKPISSDAKILYGIFLRLTGNARYKGQVDELNRPYITHSIEQCMDDIGRARATVIKVLNELSEIGLIERVRKGLGQTNVIYVKNFASIDDEIVSKADEYTEVQKLNFKKFTDEDISNADEYTEVQKLNFKKFTNENAEVQNLNFKKSNNCTHIISDDNDIDDNISIHQSSLPEVKEMDGSMEHTPEQSINQDAETDVFSTILKNTQYEKLIASNDVELVDKIFGYIHDAIEQKQPIVVGKQEISFSQLIERFTMLNDKMIVRVIDNYKPKRNEIKYPKKYILSMLYNAKDNDYAEQSSSEKSNNKHGNVAEKKSDFEQHTYTDDYFRSLISNKTPIKQSG